MNCLYAGALLYYNYGRALYIGRLAMDEVIVEGYLKWPAAEDDRIKVMRWVGDEEVGTHRHNFIEAVFLAQGACVHVYHGEKVRLIPGDIFIITPHEDHSYEISSKTVIYNCLFYPEALGEDWANLKQISGIYEFLIVEPFYRPEAGRQEILHLTPEENEAIKSILNGMLTEQENRLEGFELMQKANLIKFLCFLGRVWRKQFSGSGNLYSGRRNMLAEAMAYIEQNMKDDMKIEKLASKAYMSPNYFRKLFKETTGLTPIEYINSLRISKARRLLETGEVAISEAGEAVGINDLNYFSKIFKANTGMTPSEYKRRFKFS